MINELVPRALAVIEKTLLTDSRADRASFADGWRLWCDGRARRGCGNVATHAGYDYAAWCSEMGELPVSGEADAAAYEFLGLAPEAGR